MTRVLLKFDLVPCNIVSDQCGTCHCVCHMALIHGASVKSLCFILYYEGMIGKCKDLRTVTASISLFKFVSKAVSDKG